MKSIKNSIEIKSVNTNIIRLILQDKQKATKQELSAICGLSTVTIGAILANLVANGEVIELELLPSLGGRPAHQFCLNQDYSHFLVATLRVKNSKNVLTMQVINLKNEILKESEIVIKDVNLNSIDECVQPLINKYKKIKAIGFGLPGILNSDVIVSNDYPQLIGEDFIRHFKDKYQIEAVMANDVNLAVTGYVNTHQISEGLNVYLYFPQQFDPGAGLYWNNAIYDGLNHAAGELGYLPLDINWKALDYTSIKDTVQALFKLIKVYQCLLDPSQFILAGDFLSETHREEIEDLLYRQEYLLKKPKVKLSFDFDEDYEMGTRYFTLNAIKHKTEL